MNGVAFLNRYWVFYPSPSFDQLFLSYCHWHIRMQCDCSVSVPLDSLTHGDKAHGTWESRDDRGESPGIGKSRRDAAMGNIRRRLSTLENANWQGSSLWSLPGPRSYCLPKISTVSVNISRCLTAVTRCTQRRLQPLCRLGMEHSCSSS